MKKKQINDIDIKEWKKYDDIISDSLWLIQKRDNSGNHKGDYHGNFIPQIPYQLLARYTKENDWVLDPFLGSGTTLIECKKNNRNGIGIDIDENILNIADERIKEEKGTGIFKLLNGDSSSIKLENILKELKIKKFQFIIFHPPYWDIIKFNDNNKNLSNSATLNSFLNKFMSVVRNTTKHLEDERYLAIVIGDIYKKGEWIPLNSYITQKMLNAGFKLKSVVVKNISETKAKRNQRAIWRYRSLLGGFFVFNHEYILIFKKPKSIKKTLKN